MAEFGLGEKFEHGGGQQVRGGVAVDFERLGIFLGDDAEVGVGVEGTSEVDQVAVGLGGEGGVGQTRADGLGNVERGGALGEFFAAAVGEVYMNAVRHDILVFC